MNLDTPFKTLEIVLGEAKTTTDCDITASYASVLPTAFYLVENDLVSDGTTPVTAVPAPALGIGSAQQVKEVRLHNNDTVPHNVILQLNNNSTIRIIDTQAVAAGGDYLYTPEGGSSLVDPAPAVLVESGPALAISGMPAVDTTTLAGAEVAPWVQAGANASWSLNSLYPVLASINDFLAANPLDAPAASAADGQGSIFLGGRGDGVGTGGSGDLLGGDGGANGQGGAVSLIAGNAGGGDNDGGDANIAAGTGTGAGVNGNVRMQTLPTVDPAVSGALWNNFGLVMISP